MTVNSCPELILHEITDVLITVIHYLEKCPRSAKDCYGKARSYSETKPVQLLSCFFNISVEKAYNYFIILTTLCWISDRFWNDPFDMHWGDSELTTGVRTQDVIVLTRQVCNSIQRPTPCLQHLTMSQCFFLFSPQ